MFTAVQNAATGDLRLSSGVRAVDFENTLTQHRITPKSVFTENIRGNQTKIFLIDSADFEVAHNLLDEKSFNGEF